MPGIRPDFVVLVGTNAGRDKTRWREIGAAWWSASRESISIAFDAVPLSGKVLLKKREEDAPEDSGPEGR